MGLNKDVLGKEYPAHEGRVCHTSREKANVYVPTTAESRSVHLNRITRDMQSRLMTGRRRRSPGRASWINRFANMQSDDTHVRQPGYIDE